MFLGVLVSTPLAVLLQVTQGRHDADQWVTTFDVATSLIIGLWTSAGTGFAGNSDRDSQAEALFAAAVLARYVRISPRSAVKALALAVTIQ